MGINLPAYCLLVGTDGLVVPALLVYPLSIAKVVLSKLFEPPQILPILYNYNIFNFI